MARLCAFKTPGENGTYYVFNNEGNLMVINFDPSNPDYTQWNDATSLNSLTQTQLNRINGYDLLFYSDIEDDVYNVNMTNYDILQTTDKSHFILGGYAYLSSMTFNNTSTTSHVILSFDGRKTWWYYDTTEAEWKKTYITQIYTDKSNTVAQINSFTKDIYDLKFKKHCTLDFAMSITNSEYFGSVRLVLPPNQGPKILEIKIVANETTHTKTIGLMAKVDDMEGDNVSYKIYRSWGSGQDAVVDELIEEGDLDPDKITHYFNLDPKDFEIGTNTLKFVFNDEKGASTTSDPVYIYKVNEEAMLSASRIGDKLTYSVIDLNNEDEIDGGWMRIRISYTKTIETINEQTQKPVTQQLYQEHIITPGYDDTRQDISIPATEDEGWSDYIDGPINFSKTIQIPWDTIEFGVTNTITVEYKEDIYNSPIKIVTIPFMGTYFGVLFVDTAKAYYINNKPNKEFYYSTSLGEVLKSLELGSNPTNNSVYHTQMSISKEVGVINLTNDVIPEVTIKGFTNEKENYKVAVSTSEVFDMNSISEFKLRNIRPYDPDDINGPDLRRFYVKLFSLDITNWEVNDFVTASTKDDSKES